MVYRSDGMSTVHSQPCHQRNRNGLYLSRVLTYRKKKLHNSCTSTLLLHFWKRWSWISLSPQSSVVVLQFNPKGGAHYVSRVPLPLFIPRPSLADGVAVYSQQPVRREGKVCNGEKPQDGYTCASTVTDGCICPRGLCVG